MTVPAEKQDCALHDGVADLAEASHLVGAAVAGIGDAEGQQPVAGVGQVGAAGVCH